MLETLKIRRLTWKNDQAATVRWLGRIQKHAAPLLALPVNTISPEHIKAILQPLWASKPDTARKLKTAINHVLNWSEAHDFIEHSPMPKALKQLGDVHKAPITHQPSMPYPLIPEFVKHHLLPALSVTQNLILFVILTAVRSANARYATWDQFDLKNKIWTIPPEAMKSKKHEGAQLEVPLSQGALIILEQMREMHPTIVFPSPRKGAVLSDMSTTSFLRAKNAPSDIKDRLATLHGFRSSFKNWSLEKTTFSDELSEVALGHVVGSRVRRAYARTHQLDQRRELMEEWSNYVFQNHKNPISLGI
jgi:integrase